MKALIIVDVQNDFCEGGSLEVKNSNSIFPILNQIIQKREFQAIFVTRDWHPANHSSFAINRGKKPFDSVVDSNKNVQILWPVHCVQESQGAELSPLLRIQKIDYFEIKKGYIQTQESYSGFGTKNNPTQLLDMLKKQKIQEVVVVGLALDFCVGNTALDAAEAGLKVTVIKNATKHVSEEGARIMMSKFQEKGINFTRFENNQEDNYQTLDFSDESSANY